MSESEKRLFRESIEKIDPGEDLKTKMLERIRQKATDLQAISDVRAKSGKTEPKARVRAVFKWALPFAACLAIFAILFFAIPKNQKPVTVPETAEPSQTESESVVPVPVEPAEEAPALEAFPYTFDTEQPSEIDPSTFAHNPGVRGSDDYRIEFDLDESGEGSIPDKLPIYQTAVYPQRYSDYTESQLQEVQANMNANLDRYLACYAGPGEVETIQRGNNQDPKRIVNGLEVIGRPEEIWVYNAPMLCNAAEDWERPSKEDILYEIEHNEYVKAACKFLEITDPDISMTTTIYDSEQFGLQYEWDVRIFQKSDDPIESALNKVCRSVVLRGDNPFYGEKETTFGMTIPTFSLTVAQESVPLISMENALKEVLAGKYVRRGELYTNNDIADLTEDALVSVRLSFRNSGVLSIKGYGLYVPFYEFVFNCTDHKGDYVSQTKLILPACNLYKKPVE